MPTKPKQQSLHLQDNNRFKSLLDDLKRKFPKLFKQQLDSLLLLVSISEQSLHIIKDLKIETSIPISSAENGIGNHSGSYKTPLGLHQVSEKIGDNAPFASIFKARKKTNKIAKVLSTPDEKSAEDYITSRILWLDGLEDGVNKGENNKGINVDSHSRYIYIHGTDEEGRLGEAVSHGCIRMSNRDVIELFKKIEIGTLVMITEK